MRINHHKPPFLSESIKSLNYGKFNNELFEATYALGLLEGSQKKLHNPSLLISPLSAKEATVSSRIEGTRSTISDVFLYEAGGKQKDLDTVQVVNYRKTMSFALEESQKGRAITSHVIESLHAVLLRGVAHKKQLGKFREDTVYIAKPGDPIERATYIPPEAYLVRDYMDDLIEFIGKSKENSLIKAGIFHYQFEAIHPFNDGNGRLGRLLIPLILYYDKKLSSPILYLSGYFDANRDDYLFSLHETDQSGEVEKWLAFFLHSVAEQLRETQQLIENIYQLYDEIKSRFALNKSPYLIPFLDFLFEFPFFTFPLVQGKLKSISRLTVDRLVKLFKSEKLLEDVGYRAGNAKLYLFKPLIDLLD